ncbi:MAG: Lpg1974 family pore-forming outer membrane protein [Simkaniaceae bacterium]|nr:Lpg1974 family pore-forming outer membrane protein [Candidatus Sacchlamyda saccharinae]
MKKKAISALLLLLASKPLVANIDVYTDALYWMTTEIIDPSMSLDPRGNFETVTFQKLNFGWNPGFRIGVGYSSCCDCWETNFTYTRFEAKGSNRAADDMIKSEYFGSIFSGLGFYQKAKIEGKISYNMFDWDLGYPLCPSDCLFFRPSIGIKGGWIHQTFKNTFRKTFDILDIFFIPVKAVENLQNDFWGVGPKGGVNSKWILSNCFSLVGDFYAAFMWGHWSFFDQFLSTSDSNIMTKISDRNFGAFMLQGFFGFGLDLCDFSFKLGYEIQDWFNQYQIFDNGTGGQSGNLIFQGLTLQARYGF